MRSLPRPFYPQTRTNADLFIPQKPTPGRTRCERSSARAPDFAFARRLSTRPKKIPFHPIHRWVPMGFPEAGRALGQRTPLSSQNPRWCHGWREQTWDAAGPGQERPALEMPPTGNLPRRRWGILRRAAAPIWVCKRNQPWGLVTSTGAINITIC